MSGDAAEDELAVSAGAAGAAVGTMPSNGDNRWARHGREDLQASHTLTAPLARWAAELVEPPVLVCKAKGTCVTPLESQRKN